MINIGEYVTYVHTYTEPSWSYSYPILYTWASVFPYLCNMCTEVDRISCGRDAEHPPTLHRTKSYLMHKAEPPSEPRTSTASAGCHSAQEYWMNLFDVRANIWSSTNIYT